MKYNVDHDFFKEIDTEAKAYWLGFLYADGSMSIKTYKCSSKDFRKRVIDSLEWRVCFKCGGIKLPWPKLKEEDKCTCPEPDAIKIIKT